MLRPLVAGILFLSTIATCQTVIQTGVALPDSTRSPNPVLSCYGQTPATAQFADSLLPAASLSLSGCARENHLSSELNPTPLLPATTSSDLPEAPVAFQGGPSSADGTRDLSGTRFVPPTLVAEPNTNRRGHTVDRNFILLHAFSAAALVADLETTVRSFQGQGKATELNPLFGAHPTRARLYGIAVPINAFSFYLSYHYKKIEPGRSIWKLGPGLTIAVHTAAAINNLIATHR